jgi:hypothetical protein
MKKYLIGLLAVILAIAVSSFATMKHTTTSKQSNALIYHWYNFNGGLLDQCDPAYYSLDDDNQPDCMPAIGLVYCCVYALPNQYIDGAPNLQTILLSRNKLL